MDIQTFRAGSLQEALQLVRQSLGPDASIIDTRQVKPSRLNMFAKRQVEVDAALELPAVAADKSARDAVRTASAVQTLVADVRPGRGAIHTLHDKALQDRANGKRRGFVNHETFEHGVLEHYETFAEHGTSVEHREIEKHRAIDGHGTMEDPSAIEDHGALEAFDAIDDRDAGQEGSLRSRAAPAGQPWPNVRAALLERGFPESLASQLIHDIASRLARDESDPRLINGQIHQLLSKHLNCSGAIEQAQGTQSVVAVVGPPGAGKTTTLAKLAATCRFELGLEVGLMTLDTLRQGAVDQLLHYAEMVSAALEVVSSPDHVAAARKRLAKCDVILIDTAGRSPQAEDQLAVLSDLLRAAQPQATHLVLSGSSSSRFARHAMERYAVVQPTHLIVTKLDEAVDLGSWYPLLVEGRLPVSYLTNGQSVPRDISPATARRLTNWLLGIAHGRSESP